MSTTWTKSVKAFLANHLIWAGFGLTILYWIIETADDALLFHMGSFAQRLFPADWNEVSMRITVCCLFLLFAAYADRMMTRMNALHAEREALHKDLETALATALNGYIRVCSWCKRVEDHKDTWMPIEAYVERHTPAQFTHGICPHCLERGVL
jgi:hypothetical protein